jgi:hypothetical protein
MSLFTFGNAHEDGREFNFWFIGELNRWAQQRGGAAPTFGLRNSSAVEVKWGTHPTGEARVDWAGATDKITMSLLVSGRFLLKFRSPTARAAVTEQRLVSPGDYAIWGTDVEHTWIVEQEATILTVRWRETSRE